MRFYQYDDGTAETSYKINWPSTATEAFSVDFDDDARGKLLMGVQIPTNLTSSGAPGHRFDLGLPGQPRRSTRSATRRTCRRPSPACRTRRASRAPGFCTSKPVYDLPDVTLPTTGVHAVMSFVSGDSGTWLCTDLGGPRGHSYFTTNSFASTAIPFSVNWMMRLATPHYSPSGGEFLINGGTNVTIGGLSTMSLQFWARDTATPTFYMQQLDLGGAADPVAGARSPRPDSRNFVPNGITEPRRVERHRSTARRPATR